jgi:membrane-bound lytic murein transglycosylase B
MNNPRRWMRRAMLSALAGGGLTAAGLGGPLAGGALGAQPTSPGPSTGGGPAEDTVTSSSASTPAPDAPAQGGASETTTTITATTTAPPAPSSSSTTPPAPTPSPAPSPTPAAPATSAPTGAPTVVVQRKQPVRPTRKGSRAGALKNGASAQGQSGSGGTEAKGAGGATPSGNTPAAAPAGTPNNVALAPQVVAAQAGTLASVLGQSAVSAQALEFYRVPLFLLPIYQAAGIQYGVPWQILAAINEVETDYGNDLSVSTAGAVGWMQFMPETWLQYGVDALGAGYADPYNPVDAIFAAARYLHAAGASTNLHTAILAYNHSEAYVESVLLRAKLIAAYPQSVIATLTGLTEGSMPVAGARIAPDPATATLAALSPSSATAGAVAVGAPAAGVAGAPTPGTAGASTPGSTDAPTPAAAASGLNLPASSAIQGSAAVAAGKGRKPEEELRFVDLLGTPGEAVTAVEDGRIVKLGRSHRLGNYLALQDIYGDIFTYAGLGSIAPRYHVLSDSARSKRAVGALGGGGKGSGGGVGGVGAGAVDPGATAGSGAIPLPLAAAGAAKTAAHTAKTAAHTPKPTLPASAGSQPPLTLHVKLPHTRTGGRAPEIEAEEQPVAGGAGAPAGMGRVRLYAHPGNPVARVAAARAAAQDGAKGGHGPWLPLRVGSVVSQGTVLGHLKTLPGQSNAPLSVPLGSQAVGSLGGGAAAKTVRLRFAIRPAGDGTTVDPRPILNNWRQLTVALHPKGAKGTLDLMDATAAQVFQMSQSELERSVLSDPGIDLGACGRQDVAAGAIDGRVLAVLEFLSRSGLQPTVGALRCTPSPLAAAGELTTEARIATAAALSTRSAGDAVEITAVNGIPIARHQGAGSITDLTIRTLLTLPARFVPHQIVSLMKYPDAPNTLAQAAHWSNVRIAFRPVGATVALNPAASTTVAHSAGAAGRPAPAPQAVNPELSPAQWSALVARIGSLSEPTLSAKPSASAIRDPQADTGNHELGAGALPFGSSSEGGAEE